MMKKIGIFFLALMLVCAPLSVMGAGLVPCGGLNTDGTPEPECNFYEFMNLIEIVMDFLLFKLSIPLAAILFAYAGWLYLSSGGGDQKNQAKSIFGNVFIGLIIGLAAVLIVKAILAGLGYEGPTYFEE